MAPRATQPLPEYPITITDGSTTIGLMTPNRTGVTRSPRTLGVERRAVRQATWTGGRGNERLARDPSRFYESTDLWSMLDGQAFNGPLRCIAHVSAFAAHSTYLPTGATSSLIAPGPVAAAIKRKITIAAGAGFTTATLTFIARKVGTPANNLTIELMADNAGVPGAVLQTMTVTVASVTDNATVYRSVAVVQALSASTSYWVRFYSTATSVAYWLILCDDTGTPYLRLSATATDRNDVKFFEYKRALYALAQYRNGTTAATLLLNGDRGVAAGAQSTSTLGDTAKSWLTNEWAGCVCLITGGVNKGEFRTIASNTDKVLTLGGDAWPQACSAASSEYVILGSSKWTAITLSPALGAAVSDVKVFNGIVYIAQGQSDYIIRFREYNSTGTWTREVDDDGTNTADFLLPALHSVALDPLLPLVLTLRYGLYRANKLTSTVSVAPVVAWGTDLTFGADVPIGESDTLVTNLVEYNGQVYVAKEDGVWSGLDKAFTRVLLGTDKVIDERNGVTLVWWQGQLFLSLLNGLVRQYGSTIDDVGPDKDNGMIAARRGAVVDAVNVANRLFVSYSSPSGESTLLTTSAPGGDWHNLATLGSNSRSSGLYYQTVPGLANRLWIADRYNLWYVYLPDELHNPLNDSNMRYAWESWLVTSWLDAGTPELDHFFEELRVSSLNLNNSTRLIEVEYQTDDTAYTGTWTAFGTFVYDSPYQRLVIGGGSVTGRRIRFRFRLSCDCVTPTLLTGYEVRLNQVNEAQNDYRFAISLKDKIMLMTGSDSTQDADAIVTQLDTWARSSTPLTLRFAGPNLGEDVDGIRGHIDPLSYVVAEWNDDKLNAAGSIIFKALT